jgi:predicted nucleotidyltransferase
METHKTTTKQGLDISPLNTLLARIEETYHPLQVWLFGSRARGDNRPDSDWDLFIVVPDDTPEEKLDPVAAWHLQRGSGVSADLLPCWQSAFEEDVNTANTIQYSVSREGVLLYER